MSLLWNIEWLNSNLSRNYPFLEDVSLIDVNNSIRFPNYFIVDALFVIPFSVNYEKCIYLSKFVKIGKFVTLYFSSVVNNDVKQVGKVVIDVENANKYSVYNLSDPSEYYADANCKIVIGDLSSLNSDIPDGEYNFNEFSSCLEPRVIKPELRGVRAITVVSNNEETKLMRGVIRLVPGNNIKFDVDYDNNVITINAINGEGFFEECECEKIYPNYGPIKTINGVPPDKNGNINIVAGDCISLSLGDNFIVIKDSCSVPCCGCDELEKIIQSLSLVESNVRRLTVNIDTLSDKLTTFYYNVLLSSI